MATFDVTKKLEIYHTLYRLNRSFAAIVAHCQALEATKFFPAKSLRNFQGFTQELQAEMNPESSSHANRAFSRRDSRGTPL